MSLAVLPFTNLGSDPEREYLAAGLTDETSASLAQIDPAHLSVKGRTLRYKGTTKTVAEIGQELTVDYLVESSIRAEGSRLRVTVTLIRVRDQEHVWSQFYEREPTSLLGLQQELSTAIAEQIRLRLTPDRMSGLGRRQTQNADAYDAYLRGRYQVHRRTADGNARAIELFNRALARSIRTMPSHGPISRSRTRAVPSTAMRGRQMSAHVRVTAALQRRPRQPRSVGSADRHADTISG